MEMNWIKVTDALPVIPEGRYGIQVLVCQYDPIYDEDDDDPTKSRGKGIDVSTCSYGYIDYKRMPMFKGSVYPDGSATFMERWSYHNDSEFGPTGDTVTHWMYYPEPPKYSTKYNAEKDHLEFIYEGEEEPNESIN